MTHVAVRRFRHAGHLYAPGDEVPVGTVAAVPLSRRPHFVTNAAAAVSVDESLDGLDKDALVELAADRGIDVDGRWGVDRIRAAITDPDPSPNTDQEI